MLFIFVCAHRTIYYKTWIGFHQALVEPLQIRGALHPTHTDSGRTIVHSLNVGQIMYSQSEITRIQSYKKQLPQVAEIPSVIASTFPLPYCYGLGKFLRFRSPHITHCRLLHTSSLVIQ